MKHRIALGTVQFGLPYGIANQQGQVTLGEVKTILSYAKQHGISLLDTAVAYGESEKVLGRVGVDHWAIVSKLPEVPKDCVDVSVWVRQQLNESLERLNTDKLYALLLHRPLQLLEHYGDELWQVMSALKLSGVVKKIGFSIYAPTDLDQLFSKFPPDLIQAPFNVIDRRLERSGWLEKLDEFGVEVHVRSVFLQGLLLMDAAKRPERFERFSSLLAQWDDWLVQEKLSPLEGAILFALKQEKIDKIVLGVDGLQQLEEIIEIDFTRKVKFPKEIYSDELSLIDPSRWHE